MIERTTVRLPAELLARAKRKALAEKRTLTSLIEEGLRLVVSDKRKPAKRERRPLPVARNLVDTSRDPRGNRHHRSRITHTQPCSIPYN